MNNIDVKKPNVKCAICGKEFYVKPFRLKRIKHDITCSKKCAYKLKSKYSKGNKNHQYGLKGNKNSSFIGDRRINQYGYIMLYLPNHPMSDKHGRYREHRYVIEQSNLFDNSYFNIVNGVKILKKEFEVHHLDKNKTNNNIKNLLPLLKGQHKSIHNLKIGVNKLGELLENLDTDNQQPSLLNSIKVSRKVQRLIDEELTNKSNTSAQHLIVSNDDIV